MREIEMRYTRPELGNHTLAYRGRRYWVVQIAPGERFEYVDDSMGDYAVYDCLYGNVFAIVKDDGKGGFLGSTISHVDLGETGFGSLEEAANHLSAEHDAYIKATS
jgi:hypothetical protein